MQLNLIFLSKKIGERGWPKWDFFGPGLPPPDYWIFRNLFYDTFQIESLKNAKVTILAILATPVILDTWFLWVFLTELVIGQNYLIFKRVFGPARLWVTKYVPQCTNFFWGLYWVPSTPKNFYRSVRSIVFEIFDFKVQKHPKNGYFGPFETIGKILVFPKE